MRLKLKFVMTFRKKLKDVLYIVEQDELENLDTGNRDLTTEQIQLSKTDLVRQWFLKLIHIKEKLNL